MPGLSEVPPEVPPERAVSRPCSGAALRGAASPPPTSVRPRTAKAALLREGEEVRQRRTGSGRGDRGQGLLSRRRRRLPAGRRSPPCLRGQGGRAGGGWRRHPPPLSLSPHRGVLALDAAEEPCWGTATRRSPPCPAPAGSVPRTALRICSPTPPSPRSIPCSQPFSPPRRPTWFSPGQALGISPVPFEEPRFRLASSLPPPLRTARSRLGPPAPAAAVAPAAPAPAPQVPAARARGAHEAGSAVGGARRQQREQYREGRRREEGCCAGAADAAVRWHHSARRRRRRSAARRGEEPPRRRGSEEEEKGGRKEKEAAAVVRLRATAEA